MTTIQYYQIELIFPKAELASNFTLNEVMEVKNIGLHLRKKLSCSHAEDMLLWKMVVNGKRIGLEKEEHYLTEVINITHDDKDMKKWSSSQMGRYP